jgi:anthranilate phosphoribosyltransferase
VNLRDALEHLLSGRSLPEAAAEELLRALTGADMPPALAGAFLAALRSKGVTADELRGFARAMRALARRPAIPASPHAIDIVGTGGDASGSFNLSTGAALLTAAWAAPMYSSSSGSNCRWTRWPPAHASPPRSSRSCSRLTTTRR